ncbi:MAG TPA: RnfABCDGE type electron transport complex subunit G [Thiotrichaceae bacterium]|jgi:electron transport complex protein RnfG|nr:RnfABCDGE type electron transport complex subunit G [Thiotrichaceae bacterium]HIM09102.1 RnfABCDGE type electron transport complex subunit G [Gammaproteobacteria bacterium]
MSLINKQKLISALPLTITSFVCFIIIFTVHILTKDKISINKERTALAVINEVIPVEYDNDLFHDKITIDVPVYINNTNRITVYRARVNNQPVALSLMPVISKGYNGNINLVIGVSYDGNLLGVRIINHNETPGFGDQAHQDNSDWLLGFKGYSLETAEKKWAIKKDDGEFDQLSGATITSRSIINIIYKTLEYYSENRDKFYK